ncbi:MAG: hypothetical protein ACKVQW_13140, partial [Pyrinomonadaceae bacterium]
IPVPTSVTLAYDNLGNRTQMTDGLGTQTYGYNELSQMTAETRQFNDTLSNAPLSDNRFKLEYAYTLSGQIRYYKDPYGQQFTQTQDKTGRMTAISANASFGGVINYADSPQYRAWGALKHLEYGDNNAEMNVTYNNRLGAATFEVVKNSQNIIKKEYTYLNDGNLKYAQDLVNNKFDRLYEYDFAKRVTNATTGAYARGQTGNLEDIPYDQGYAYNAFGAIKSRSSTNWVDEFNFSYDLVNNRNQQSGWTYDASGNLTHGQNLDYLIDAAGLTGKSSNDTLESLQYFDGDGAETKRSERNKVNGQWETPTVKYFVRSSVMKGEIVSEAKNTGAKERTNVYSNGIVIAKQVIHTDASENVGWEHTDVSQAEIRYTNVNYNGAPYVGKSTELDYLGNHVGLQYVNPPAESREHSPDERLPVAIVRGLGGCQLDGIPTDCELVNRLMGMGATEYSVTLVKTQKTDGPPNLTGGSPSAHESAHGRSQIETIRLPIVYLGAGLFGTTVFDGDRYDNEGPFQQWSDVVFSLEADVSQLGGDPCDLMTVGFDQLGIVNLGALKLLNNRFGNQARAQYESMRSANQLETAAFLNTAAAINAQGIDLSGATFIEMYRGGKANAGAFGITVSGITTSMLDAAGMTERSIDLFRVPTDIKGVARSRRSPGIDEGSLEATVFDNGDVAFDVDLYNPFGSAWAKAKHLEEVINNSDNNTTTHPADVLRKIKGRFTTGVTCK